VRGETIRWADLLSFKAELTIVATALAIANATAAVTVVLLLLLKSTEANVATLVV